ncbi:Exonuclease mut-7 [Dimargaris xerosporica]|nr:Exonuclease mut-7 [Dimargaris xerosporica]
MQELAQYVDTLWADPSLRYSLRSVTKSASSSIPRLSRPEALVGMERNTGGALDDLLSKLADDFERAHPVPPVAVHSARRIVAAVYTNNPEAFQFEVLGLVARTLWKPSRLKTKDGELLTPPQVRGHFSSFVGAVLRQHPQPALFALDALLHYDGALKVLKDRSWFTTNTDFVQMASHMVKVMTAALRHAGVLGWPADTPPVDNATGLVAQDRSVDNVQPTPRPDHRDAQIQFAKALVERPSLALYYAMDMFQFERVWQSVGQDPKYLYSMTHYLVCHSYLLEATQLMVKYHCYSLVPPGELLMLAANQGRVAAMGSLLKARPDLSVPVLASVNYIFYVYFEKQLIANSSLNVDRTQVLPEVLARPGQVRAAKSRADLLQIAHQAASAHPQVDTLHYSQFYYVRLAMAWGQTLYLSYDMRSNSRDQRLLRVAQNNICLRNLMCRNLGYTIGPNFAAQVLRVSLAKYGPGQKEDYQPPAPRVTHQAIAAHIPTGLAGPKPPKRHRSTPPAPVDMTPLTITGLKPYYLPRGTNVHLVTTAEGLDLLLATARDSTRVGIDGEWVPAPGFPLFQWISPKQTDVQSSQLALFQLAFDGHHHHHNDAPTVFLVDLIALAGSETKADADSGASSTNTDNLARFYGILVYLLTNPALLKIAYAFASDVQVLKTNMPGYAELVPNIRSLCDLHQLPVPAVRFTAPHKEKSGDYKRFQECRGLAKLVRASVGRYIDKKNQTSDWAYRPLALSQMHYAAVDVAVLLDIFDHYATKSPNQVQAFKSFFPPRNDIV